MREGMLQRESAIVNRHVLAQGSWPPIGKLELPEVVANCDLRLSVSMAHLQGFNRIYRKHEHQYLQ
jgi:hypothetical protein